MKQLRALRNIGFSGERGFRCIKLGKQTRQIQWLVLGRQLPFFQRGLPVQFNPIAVGI